MADMFWLNNPTILLNKKYIMEIWPTQGLSNAAKLNAITRLVIVLTILGYVCTHSLNILISAAVTLFIIAIIYKTQQHNIVKKKINHAIAKEGFTNPSQYEMVKQSFTAPTKQNPLMNVLLPEIKYKPQRKAAAPAFNPVVEKKVNEAAGNVGPDPRLFVDLGDNISFEQSMRNFHSTANTRIPNDQTAFAKWCYGDMPSCKENAGSQQCVLDNERYINY
tara:strand:- start:37 stop:696 length:660 start_codon:yes stop_codon:yes gene_type:complete